MKNTLNKKEKLKSVTEIDTLFSNGHSIKSGPLVLLWRFANFQDEVQLKMGVSVSKKRFKKAVDRNRIKRLLREGYRLNKSELYEQLKTSQKQVAFFLIYRGSLLPDSNELQDKIILIIQRLVIDLKEQENNENTKE